MEVKGIKLEILLKADCASRRDSRYADKEAKDKQRLLAVVPVQPNVDSVVVHDDGGQRLPARCLRMPQTLRSFYFLLSGH